ncbi:MAG TPA: hypothetical protein VJV05_00440 [Pyrinomonadaceae bacterium]|nr:hypothetical protein [Pyrinomonadaceae bacterium]
MKEIDQYLLGEMPESERQQFEERFVADETLFYEVVERENELVDQYAAGKLGSDELTQFEKSLAANPARRQKVANAKLINEFVVEHREDAKTITIAERSGFFSRLSDLFRMPALQLGSAAVIVAFALWSTYLLAENRRLRSLETELASARTQQTELEKQVENEQEASGALADDLTSARDRVKKLEETVASRRQGDVKTPPEANVLKPTIATLFLSTAVGRDGAPFVPRLEVSPTETKVSLMIQLEKAVDRVDVRLNGANVARAVRVRDRAGDKVISITVPTSSLKDGANSVEILDTAGQRIAERDFSIVRRGDSKE